MVQMKKLIMPDPDGNENIYELVDDTARNGLLAKANASDVESMSTRINNFIDNAIQSEVTTLWSGTINTINQSVILSESVSNFDFIDIYTSGQDGLFTRVPVSKGYAEMHVANLSDNASVNFLQVGEMRIDFSNTTATLTKAVTWKWNPSDNTSPTVTQDTLANIVRIDGIRTGQNNVYAELVDVRVGADGVTYANAGDAVRTQFANVTKSGNVIDAFSVGDYSGYITPSGGIGGNASYHYSELMPTKEGDMWCYVGLNNSAGLSFVWGYSDKNFSDPTPLVPAGRIDGEKIIIIPSGINYIRAFGVVDSQTVNKARLLHGKNVFFYDSTLGSIRTFFDTYIVNPTRYNKYVVYVLPNTYNFDSEFTEEEKASASFIGVSVPKWTTLIGFHGKERTTIKCTLASNSISTLNLQTGSGLQDLTILGENCRYAIHDDFGYNNDEDERYIADCIIQATNCSYGYAYGGGCRSSQKFKYDRCVFKATNYDGGGFLMHSNTTFTIPATLVFNDCEFYSLVGHFERAVNIRGLGNTSVINKAIFNNCHSDGFYLQKNTVFDWDITGSGNSVCPTVTDSDCATNFADNPYTDASLANTAYSALAVGSFRFASGIPQWWDGSQWVKADGTSV